MELPFGAKPRMSFDFEVEKILGISADGRYQVQWAPAWVSKFHLVGCEHIIEEFLQQQGEKEACPEPNNDNNLTPGLSDVGVNRGDQMCVEQLGIEVKAEPEPELEPELEVAFPYFANEADAQESLIQEPVEEQSEAVFKPDTEFQYSRLCGLNSGYSEVVHLEEDEEDISQLMSSKEMEGSDRTEQQQGADKPIPGNECVDSNSSIRSTTYDQRETHQLEKQISKPTNKTFCEICHKEFQHKNNLSRHMKIHTGKKTHKCPYCSKKYYRKDNLNNHIRYHTGEHRFHCKKCNYSSVRKAELNRHMLTHT